MIGTPVPNSRFKMPSGESFSSTMISARSELPCAAITKIMGSGLRAVVALDDHDVGDRMRLPPFDILLIFRRPVASHRGYVIRSGKFESVEGNAARTTL
jgi:hypothetical protein